MLRRAIPEYEVPLGRLDGRRVRPEQFGEPRPSTPQRRRLGARRRRHVLADGLEDLADEALRRPTGKADLAAALADTNQLTRRAVLVGREPHPEGRGDRIEGARSEAHTSALPSLMRTSYAGCFLNKKNKS